MFRHLRRRAAAFAVAAGLSAATALTVTGPAFAAPANPAGSVSVVSPPPAAICLYGDCAQLPFCSDGACVPGPAPACASGYCIPQTPVGAFGVWVPQSWYVATSVITNEGLWRFGTPVVGENPTTVDNPGCVSLAQTVTGSATATLQGTFGVDNPAAIAGAVAEIQPGVSASVGYSYTFTGTAPCPPEKNTTIYFGIGYIQTTGTVYSLSATGQITSRSGVVASTPTGWAYYTQYTPAVSPS